MSIKNPGSRAIPDVVIKCASALEEKLGRPPYVRQVKNREEWWISDPMFSYVQHGLRKGVTGYRTGYFYSLDENVLAFYLVHSPVMAKIFKKNLHLSAIIHALEGCGNYCKAPRMIWSSRVAQLNGEKNSYIEEVGNEFLILLRELNEQKFIADLFPSIENQKTGVGPALVAGNDFFLLLAENVSKLASNDIKTIIESSWPLFLCLYPVGAIEQRVASLARNLNAAKLAKVCEYEKIAGRPDEAEISSVCRGEIEGAHIKPHAKGGTDRFENGLWLCQYHHRKTEGRITGKRDKDKFAVRFIGA